MIQVGIFCVMMPWWRWQGT